MVDPHAAPWMDSRPVDQLVKPYILTHIPHIHTRWQEKKPPRYITQHMLTIPTIPNQTTCTKATNYEFAKKGAPRKDILFHFTCIP